MKAVVIKYAMAALSLVGSASLLFACDDADAAADTPNTETLMTEQSENLAVVMSENGRKSYFFKTPLLEGYTLARDPYREFRKGIDITTYQDDSLSTENAHLTSNYAIYYENRKLWEAKGDVVVIKADGTQLYTQQLFWNSMTHRIYSNVDTKIVKGSDVFFGEGFESDEELKQWRFRRMSGRMFVNVSQMQSDDDEAESENGGNDKEEGAQPETAAENGDKPVAEPESAAEEQAAPEPPGGGERPEGEHRRRPAPRRDGETGNARISTGRITSDGD